MQEYWVPASDGTWLRVVDFTPAAPKENALPLLYIAGWISLIDGIKPVLSELIGNRRVIYLETREKNTAIMPPTGFGQYTVQRFAEDVHEVVGQLLGDQAYAVAGSSLGATTILHYLAQNGIHEPKKALLIAPNAQFKMPMILVHSLTHLPNFFAPPVMALTKWLLKFRVKEPAQYEKYCRTISAAEPGRLKRNARRLSVYKIWEQLPLVSTPCVIIGANTDKLHGLDDINAMHAKLSHSLLHIMQSNKATHSAECGRFLELQLRQL